jgi:hypothetical protein
MERQWSSSGDVLEFQVSDNVLKVVRNGVAHPTFVALVAGRTYYPAIMINAPASVTIEF